MKYILLIILLSASVLNISAQILDSIPYEYGNLYYQVYGNGGETILLLSGGPGNDAQQLVPMAKKLGLNNRVILLEQRGTGRSIPSPFNNTTINLTFAIDDINKVINDLDLDNIVLIGHSYGASLATVYSAKYPKKIKACILVSPGSAVFEMYLIAVCNIESKLGKEESARWNQLYYPAIQNSLDSLEKEEYNYLTKLAYVYDKNIIDNIMPMIDGFNNKDTFNYLSRDMERYGDSIYQDLNNIKSPIHIISGRQDLFSHMPYELKLRNPDVNIHWIHQCGHFPMFEKPKEFYTIIENIINYD